MMQLTEKRKLVQPWWVIFLLIPMLVSCALGPIFWEVALLVGGQFMYTATGEVIERIVDQLVDKMFHADSPGYVTPDRDNPLQGTYSKEMKFTTVKNGVESRVFQLNQPRMVRDSTSSTWRLAPDLQEMVNQILKGGA